MTGVGLDRLPFRRIWCVDFEFGAQPGERSTPVCLVARVDNFRTQEIASAGDCEPELLMMMLEEDRYDSQPLLNSMPMPSNKLEIIPTDIDIIEIELIYNMYKNSIIYFYESMIELHGCIMT